MDSEFCLATLFIYNGLIIHCNIHFRGSEEICEEARSQLKTPDAPIRPGVTIYFVTCPVMKFVKTSLFLARRSYAESHSD